ncbi:MAG TPA: ABC transporter substrate-binding protein [Pseudolabrys sp.]|jgi:putative ABC transport system substrate-binding protein|nr:ABC transporter substrate-binding protein [Pseudolabrys sp.]
MRRREFIVSLAASAAAWPLVARAQQVQKIPKVGYLWHAASAKEENPYYGAVIEGFARLGYVNGRNIVLEHRFPNEKPELFAGMAAELVAMNPEVLMGGSVASFYLNAATKTIPIVFMFVPDPVGMKLVNSLARPGGNITGLSNFGLDIAGKRVQLLKEIVPGLSRLAMLINSNQQTASMYVEVTRKAARDLGVTVDAFDALGSRKELDDAFDAMTKAGMQAVIPAQGGTAFQWRAIIPRLAIEHRLPLCAFSRETFEDGALISYGPDQVALCVRSAALADKIIKGEKPADIPVEQPTKFEFLVNLRTARALGLTVPAGMLIAANEVVE